MSDLSPESQTVLEMVRGGDDPTEDDRARVRHAVLLRVGTAAGAAAIAVSATKAATAGTAASGTAGMAPTAAGATAAGVSLIGKIAAVAGVAAVVAAGGAVALRNEGARAPEQAKPSVAAIARAAAELRPIGSEPVEAVATPSPSAEAGSASRPPGAITGTAVMPDAAGSTKPPRTQAGSLPATSAESLEDEVRLLQSAHAELSAGRADQALALLDQHAQGFGAGAMAEERRAARIVTLCKLGRVAEARAEAVRFVRDFPRSPAAQRMRSVCPGDN